MRQIIIVTDAAPLGDDAVAIAMLVGGRPHNISLIVATSGNVWAADAAQNVRNLLSQLRRNDMRHCVGAPAAAFKDRWLAYASEKDGAPAGHYVGAFAHEFPKPREGDRDCGDLFELIKAVDRPDLLIIGPASPIAPIVRAHPDLANYVGRVFLMGGAITCEGNATPAAEFNFWFDPDAAEALLASDLPITLLPLDAARTSHYSAEFAASLHPSHPVTGYIRKSVEIPGGLAVCDELLAAVILDRGVASAFTTLKLSVETELGPRYGAVNILDDSADRRAVEVIARIDQTAFSNLARRVLRTGGEE
jgi:inosine-uridine nucleoside N-ribohydrolase